MKVLRGEGNQREKTEGMLVKYTISVKNKFTSISVMVYDNIFCSFKTQEQFSPKGDNKVR